MAQCKNTKKNPMSNESLTITKYEAFEIWTKGSREEHSECVSPLSHSGSFYMVSGASRVFTTGQGSFNRERKTKRNANASTTLFHRKRYSMNVSSIHEIPCSVSMDSLANDNAVGESIRNDFWVSRVEKRRRAPPPAEVVTETSPRLELGRMISVWHVYESANEESWEGVKARPSAAVDTCFDVRASFPTSNSRRGNLTTEKFSLPSVSQEKQTDWPTLSRKNNSSSIRH